MKLLVTGTAGQLAQALLAAGEAAGIEVIPCGRPQLDLTEPATIRDALSAARPDLVVNAAAHTGVDKAESEPELAMRINAVGAGVVAETCHALGVPVIHLSTDYVFDGAKGAPYLETDALGPLGAYGRSKVAGEQAVAAACARHVILRTAWVHSAAGTNFVRTMLRLGATRPALGVVDDQRGCPTYAPHLAAAILALAPRVAAASAAEPIWGIYHAVGAGETTWCGFAREIFRRAGPLGGPTPRVDAITTAEYPTPARRPANSRLDCEKLASVFGVRLPDWREGTRLCVERLVTPST